MSLELPSCNVIKTKDRITTTSDMKVGRSYYCFKIKNETRTCFIRYITWLNESKCNVSFRKTGSYRPAARSGDTTTKLFTIVIDFE